MNRFSWFAASVFVTLLSLVSSCAGETCPCVPYRIMACGSTGDSPAVLFDGEDPGFTWVGDFYYSCSDALNWYDDECYDPGVSPVDWNVPKWTISWRFMAGNPQTVEGYRLDMYIGVEGDVAAGAAPVADGVIHCDDPGITCSGRLDLAGDPVTREASYIVTAGELVPVAISYDQYVFEFRNLTFEPDPSGEHLYLRRFNEIMTAPSSITFSALPGSCETGLGEDLCE